MPPLPARLRRLGPAALMVAAVTAVFWRPLWTEGTLYLREIGGYALPLREYFRASVLDGRVPQWMPHMNLGLPFAADPGNSVFYPLNVLLLALPWPQAFDVFVFAHVALAAVGAAGLGRSLGVGATAAAAGGLTFGLSGYVLSMTSSFTYLVGPTWAPLALQVALSDAPALRRVPAFAAVVAMQVLGGDLQAALLTTVFAVALVAARAPVGASPALRRVGATILGSLLALAVSGIQLVPASQFVRESVRREGVPLVIAEHFSLHPVRLIDLAAPGATGDTPPDAAYLGRKLVDERHTWPFALSLYLGAGALALAPLGTRGRLGRVLLALGGLALLVALGRHAGLHTLLWHYMPLWSMFRYPEKLLAFTTLAVAMLVSLGTERALQGEPAARPAWVATAVLLAASLAVLVAAKWLPGGVDLATRISARTAIAAISVAAMGVLLRFGSRAALGMLPVAIAIDLGAHGMRLVDALPSRPDLPLPVAAVGERQSGHPPRGFATANARAAVERASSVRQMERLASALALPDRALDRLQHLESRTAAQAATGEALITALHGHGKRMLDLLNVEWVLQTDEDPQNPALDVAAGPLAGVTVRKNRDAAPRARMFFHTAVAPNEASALAWIADPRFPASQVAIVESHGPDLRSMRGPLACGVTRYLPERVDVQCQAPEAALLVLADQHLSGWSATVDGRPAALLRADVALRAVLLSAGRHAITFSYATPGLVAGGWISAAALALCAAMLIGSRRP